MSDTVSDTSSDTVSEAALRPHLFDCSPDELRRLCAEWGEPAYRARQIAQWALRRGVTDFQAMTDLPDTLRERLAAAYRLDAPPVLRTVAADDGATRKVLLDLREQAGEGGERGAAEAVEAVEVVRMAYDPDRPQSAGRATVCVSTQIGCAMGCTFCATGQQGFTRNLRSAEILAQVLHFARTERVTNVVFMGMGEPLANYGPTLAAIRWLVHPHGLDMRARGITVSTVGLPHGIRRLADEALQVGLTISLHAPDDALRRRLVPMAGGTTIDQLLAAAREYIARTGRRVTFAYALLDGVNDQPAHARALAQRVRGMQAHVNLIPYNPTAGAGLRRPSRERVSAFQRTLQQQGINATVRAERGVEIAAACGQLRTDELASAAATPA